MEEIVSGTPLITNDAVVFGILMGLLGLIFYTAGTQTFSRFYKVVPALLMCYFAPSIFNTLGIISPAWIDVKAAIAHLASLGHDMSDINNFHKLKQYVLNNDIKDVGLEQFMGTSRLYFMASRYLLPASLVLLTLSIDLKEILKLGPKALIMFFTATIGVVLGGPLAVFLVGLVSPETVGGSGSEAVWKGLSTVAGSWIGGGANQAAMFEIFKPSSRLYSIMITVDVIVAEIWMFFLLLGVGKNVQLDKWLKADSSAVEHLKQKMEDFSMSIARITSFKDLMIILGIGFVAVGMAHFGADLLAPFIQENFPALSKISLTSKFFWLIVLATIIGIVLSFSRARSYEGAGASKIGSVFIYVLVATIGMKMNVLEIFSNPGLFAVGIVWMAFHVILLVIVAKLIRSPYFFLAVGSKANIGGAASAPVVAGAFHPSLAPVGVLLAVLGYAIGTGAAWLCGLMMQAIAAAG